MSNLQYEIAQKAAQDQVDIYAAMKILTLNFLTCARKTCKSTAAAFPLHCREGTSSGLTYWIHIWYTNLSTVELEQVEIDMNPLFIKNMLPRLDWEAMKSLTQEVIYRPGLDHMPIVYTKPSFASLDFRTYRRRHRQPKSYRLRMASHRKHARTFTSYSWRPV